MALSHDRANWAKQHFLERLRFGSMPEATNQQVYALLDTLLDDPKVLTELESYVRRCAQTDEYKRVLMEYLKLRRQERKDHE